jgi:hypothetical protein
MLSPLKNMNILAAVPKNAQTAKCFQSLRQSMALSLIKRAQILKRQNAVSMRSHTKPSALIYAGIISPAHENNMA